jgi:KUP system potassium uptake protein
MVLPGAAVFLTVELAFFAANLGKLFSGGWLPLAVGSVFFVILTTWRRAAPSCIARCAKDTCRCAGSSTG